MVIFLPSKQKCPLNGRRIYIYIKGVKYMYFKWIHPYFFPKFNTLSGALRRLTGGIKCAGAGKLRRTSTNKAAVHNLFQAKRNNTVQIQLEFYSPMLTQSAFIGTLAIIFRAGSNICETSPHVFKIWHTHLGSRQILKGVGKETRNTQIVRDFASNPILFAVKCREIRSWWVKVAGGGVKRL